MEFKDKLKQLRTDKRLSQVELADALGLSHSVIAMYESGYRMPRENIRESMAKYFGIGISELMCYTALPVGKETFMKAYNNAMFKLNRQISDLLDLRCRLAWWDELSTIEKIICLGEIYDAKNNTADTVKFLQGIAEILAELSPVEADIYAQKVAKEYNISEIALRKEIEYCVSRS